MIFQADVMTLPPHRAYVIYAISVLLVIKYKQHWHNDGLDPAQESVMTLTHRVNLVYFGEVVEAKGSSHKEVLYVHDLINRWSMSSLQLQM